jgi:hypothetical protein
MRRESITYRAPELQQAHVRTARLAIHADLAHARDPVLNLIRHMGHNLQQYMCVLQAYKWLHPPYAIDPQAHGGVMTHVPRGIRATLTCTVLPR